MSGRSFGSLVHRGVFALGALSAVALAGCASDWESAYEHSEREKLDMQARLETVQHQRATDAARAEALDQQNRALEREIGNVRSDSAGRGEMEATAPAAAPVEGAAIEARADQFRKVYGAEGVTVTPDGNIEVELPSDVTFAAGSTVLTDSAKKSLRKISSLLNGEFSSNPIRVEGHTDGQPLDKTREKFGDNRGLGSARALEVVRFMENDLRIEPRRLSSASKGEHHPVADNKTAAGRAKNRRVEVVVIIPREGTQVEAK